jgi:DNA gyrase subunit B
MGEWAATVEAIRLRPGLYIGNTGSNGCANLVMELVSNSFDQAIAGLADHISIFVAVDGTTIVSDNGAGISVAKDDDQVTFLERVLTEFRTTPVDRHQPHVHLSLGIGLGPLCALSEFLEVTTSDGSNTYRQCFARGFPTSGLVEMPTSTRGTTVRYRPDPTIFPSPSPRMRELEPRVRTLAALVRGITVDLDVAAHYVPNAGLVPFFEEVFGSPHDRWRTFLVDDSADGARDPFVIEATTADGTVELVFGFSKYARISTGNEIRGFCNYAEMTQGGAHIEGLEVGLRSVFGEAAPKVLRHMKAIIHVTLSNPEFGGPTRSKLQSREAAGLVADALTAQLPLILEHHPVVERGLRSLEG